MSRSLRRTPLTPPSQNLIGTLFAAASAFVSLVPGQSHNAAPPPPIVAPARPTLLPVGVRLTADQPLGSAASEVALPEEPGPADASGAQVSAPTAEFAELSAVPIEAAASALPAARNAEEAFIFKIVPGAKASQKATGVPASVTIAQAILESSWGRSYLAREANNLFGVKALTKPGPAGVLMMDAWEVENGFDVVRPEPFRKYNSVAESIADHGLFFVENSRYRDALRARDDANEFARRIAAAGYATDPGYAPKLIGLMERWDLHKYDG